MKNMPSFEIDHTRLLRGVYLSRKDFFGVEVVTTFDIRLKEPNREDVLDVDALHTMEHLGASFLRNHPACGDRIVYWGPMGCRTGFYLLMHGNYRAEDIVPLIKETFRFMSDYTGEIPGASPQDCGNCLSHDLPMARCEAEKYLREVLENITPENMEYPTEETSQNFDFLNNIQKMNKNAKKEAIKVNVDGERFKMPAVELSNMQRLVGRRLRVDFFCIDAADPTDFYTRGCTGTLEACYGDALTLRTDDGRRTTIPARCIDYIEAIEEEGRKDIPENGVILNGVVYKMNEGEGECHSCALYNGERCEIPLCEYFESFAYKVSFDIWREKDEK